MRLNESLKKILNDIAVERGAVAVWSCDTKEFYENIRTLKNHGLIEYKIGRLDDTYCVLTESGRNLLKTMGHQFDNEKIDMASAYMEKVT